MHAHFLIDVIRMRFDRSLGDEELIGYVFGIPPLGEVEQYLALMRCEIVFLGS